MNERWLPIPGWEGLYEASTAGRIRSLSRGEPRILRPGSNGRGYLVLGLWRDGNQHGFSVHSLILLTFVGPRPHGKQINHIDGDRKNNRLENLEYCTQSENMRHRIDSLGSDLSGTRNPSAKLDPTKVRKIRELRRRGMSERKIAPMFGVSHRSINKIINRETWAHVEDAA